MTKVIVMTPRRTPDNPKTHQKNAILLARPKEEVATVLTLQSELSYKKKKRQQELQEEKRKMIAHAQKVLKYTKDFGEVEPVEVKIEEDESVEIIDEVERMRRHVMLVLKHGTFF